MSDSILGILSESDLHDLGIDKLGERKRLLSAFNVSVFGRATSAMVEVEGGMLPHGSELAGTKVSPFEI